MHVDKLHAYCCNKAPINNQTLFTYSLIGAGWGKAIPDIIGMATFSSDANVAYIGGFNGYYSLLDVKCCKGSAYIRFHVDNNTGLASASRSPTTGNSWFPNNPFGSTGLLSTVHEHFDWVEPISFTPCNSVTQ
jgi:hypothetical protein